MRHLLIGLALCCFSVGCKSAEATYCEKYQECTLPSLDVESCEEDIQAFVDTGILTEAAVDTCAGCFGDKTCAEISSGECNAECAAAFSMLGM